MHRWTWENLKAVNSRSQVMYVRAGITRACSEALASNMESPITADLLEQYKLYVQSAENVSSRRVQSSRYLLTLNAALVALYGFQSVGFWAEQIGRWWFPIIGMPVSILWFLIIKSHADLNKVKFEIIHELEGHLPAAMYKYEWQLADKGHGKAYRAVTNIEKWIPLGLLLVASGIWRILDSLHDWTV